MMTSEEFQQVYEAHQAIKGLMLLLDDHSDLSELKPEYLYFLLLPHVNSLEQLLTKDGQLKAETL